MRIIPFLAIVTIFFSCNQPQTFEFKNTECSNTDIPEFDGQIVSILDNETGEVVKDTLIEKIKKTRNILNLAGSTSIVQFTRIRTAISFQKVKCG